MLVFKKETLLQLATDVIEACQTPPADALLVAEHLVESNLLGHDSHGVMRIPQYVQLVAEGDIHPGKPLSILRDDGATLLVDCGYNFGQVGATQSMQLAMDRAAKQGISCVLVSKASHTGRLGAYTTMAAQAGMIALATCNSPSLGHFVAPFGGLEGRLATNPLSYAVPTGGDPIVFDASTSSIPEGKIRWTKNRGKKLAPDMIIDAQGNPSTDPDDFYGPPRGAILPFGGPSGYKGTGLALLAELLSGTLAGHLITDGQLKGNNLCFIVIKIGNFVENPTFRLLADQIGEHIRSSRPIQEGNAVLMPGELEFKMKRLREKEGIEIETDSWKKIVRAAIEVGIPADRTDAMVSNVR